MRRKGRFPGRKPRPAQALPTPATPCRQTPFDREQTTKRRGEISELAFALAAARHGFGIAKPFGDSERYDIILDCRTNDCWKNDYLKDDCPKNNPTHVPSVISTVAERQRAKWRDPLYAPRPRLVRVQVKSSTQMLEGFYRVNAHRRINGRAVPYTLAEIDFFVAYVIPEDSWFIFPLPHILGLTSLLLSPKRRRHPALYDSYREAWHYLHQPDGLEFA